jgi:hypothetical protein
VVIAHADNPAPAVDDRVRSSRPRRNRRLRRVITGVGVRSWAWFPFGVGKTFDLVLTAIQTVCIVLDMNTTGTRVTYTDTFAQQKTGTVRRVYAGYATVILDEINPVTHMRNSADVHLSALREVVA